MSGYSDKYFLVAHAPARDLLLCAKDLFIAAIVPGPTFLRAASRHARRTPVGLLRFLVALSRVRDLLLRAKHLFVAARTVRHRRQLSRGERDRVGCSSQCSLTGHLNRSIDGVFEIVRVIGRRLVSIAEVHAVVARAHLAQSEPEMACNRFGLLERHEYFRGTP